MRTSKNIFLNIIAMQAYAIEAFIYTLIEIIDDLFTTSLIKFNSFSNTASIVKMHEYIINFDLRNMIKKTFVKNELTWNLI